MKKIILLILYFIISEKIYSQDKIDLTELKAPSSPAFTILGVQPSDIARPKTFEALEANIFSSFTNNSNFVLPDNYALEFSPYWLTSHPYLSYSELAPNLGQTILENLSLSVANSQAQKTMDTSFKYKRIGMGLRTMIIDGKTNSHIEALILDTIQQNFILMTTILENLSTTTNATELDALKMEIKNAILTVQTINERMRNDLADDIYDRLVRANNNSKKTISVTATRNLISTVRANLIADPNIHTRAQEAAKNLQEINKDKYGFMLEVAGAMALDFPTNRTDYSKVNKWGIWITPSYRFKDIKGKSSDIVEIIGVIRYLRNEVIENFSDNFDLGVRAVWGIKKFSFSGEVIHRFQSVVISKEKVDDFIITTTKSYSDTRFDFSLEYKISDKTVISYTFGQNFTLNTEFEGNLISIVSLNFGFGGPSINK